MISSSLKRFSSSTVTTAARRFSTVVTRNVANQAAAMKSADAATATSTGACASTVLPPSAFAVNVPAAEQQPYHGLIIDPARFDPVIDAARDFFRNKMGMQEVHAQNRLSILAACEDPRNVASFNYLGNVWPLPQTSQMWLEYELLTKKHDKGFFSVSTSYRIEPEAVQGRHFSIFPMIEFEAPGGEVELEQMLDGFLAHLGLRPDQIGRGAFEDVQSPDTQDVDHACEEKLYQSFPAFKVTRFPERSNPFWNMRRTADGAHAHKIDVIMGGQETIGAAERSSDIEQMRQSFYSVEGGEYAKLLFKLFGKERVEQELNDFLALPMFPRYGGGIGVTRLIQAMERYKADGHISE